MDATKQLHVTTRPSPPDNDWTQNTPLPYTSDPFLLLWGDIKLFFQQAWSLPYIILPLKPWRSGSLDELYPSWPNLYAILIHTCLVTAQTLFLLSIIPVIILPILPFGIAVAYIVTSIIASKLLCDFLLNDCPPILTSDVDLSVFPSTHPKERWIFINGIAVGKHWLQSNINRIALTFGRPVYGVHNPTTGIVFDIIEAIIQRDFTYATRDIRNGYVTIKQALQDDGVEKVVLVLHSQGALEGGLILDWLFADVPERLLAKLEVYTFGNAANHFNNPIRTSSTPSKHVLRYIEHYANSKDFVSRWGVLHFASPMFKTRCGNRFEGRVFGRIGGGHQFNQHYLDNMFPLDTKRGWGVLEQNPFMDSPVDVTRTLTALECNGDKVVPAKIKPLKTQDRSMTKPVEMSMLGPALPEAGCTVGQLSRLWQYRNGRSPVE